jgi:hypothetical protein
MTPEEKAEELVLKYLRVKTHQMFNGWWHKMTAKQCALIAVDELIKSWDKDLYENCGASEYWQEVKYYLLKL